MDAPVCAHARSYLFVPGNRPERFAKAAASGADALILDLEDSVPVAEKAAAREAVGQWLAASPPAVPAWIRVNPLTSFYHLDDLQVVARTRPAGIVLPKCEGMDDVMWVDKVLAEIERRAGWPNRSILVMAIATETARALQRIHTFDHAMARLAGILWGAEDLAAALGVRSLRDAQGHYLSPALRARDSALLASHACGIPAIDAVYTGLDDPEGLAAETRAHRALGFSAKAAIHPAQIAVIHAALRPGDDDTAWAREVIAELQDGARASGRVRGTMVDQPHLVAARRILAAARP
ncbi:MAG TPA: CoA ester lyase [Burkholderiaceae bacterium]